MSFLKKWFPAGAALIVVMLAAGCRPSFAPLLQKAERSFAEKNHIDTIDALNLAIPNWKESDGNENKARAYELLGKSYHALKNYEKAMTAFRQAIQLSDKTFDSAYTLGTLHLLQSKPDRAADVFQTALRMKPNDPLALLGLANSYYGQKRYGEALRTYQKVLDVSPGVKDALASISALQSQLNRSRSRRRRR